MKPTDEINRDFKNILATLFSEASEGFSGLPDSKQKVFISFCYGPQRATTVNGVGKSLKTAFDAARNLAVKAASNNTKLPKWILVNIVTGETSVTIDKYYGMLEKTRRGYLRYGVSFDPLYNIAFLEQEIYGNNLIKYISKKEQQFFSENITAYLKRSRGYRANFSFEIDMSKPIICFETAGAFYDEGKYIAIDSSIDSLNYGIREIDFTNNLEDAPGKIMALVNKTADMLISTMKPDGSFVYGYFSCFNALVPGYNVLRATLGVFALADLYLLNKKSKYKDAALRGLSHILDNFVYHHDDETAFIIDHVKPEVTEIKLGGLGLTILTITKCMEMVDDKDKYLPLLRKIGNGILYLQDKETGNYNHVLDYPSMDLKEAFRIVYYAGEATFALSRLYTVDRDQKWLASIERAFDFFIANDYHEYSDHWLAYAVNELALYKTDDKYLTFGLKNIFYDLDFVISRDTTWNTFLEMINASFSIIEKIQGMGKEYLLAPYDVKKLLTAMDARFQVQLASIMFPEMAMFFKSPQTILYGVFIRHHTFRVRNDDIAHHIMGYSNYYRILFGDNKK